MSFTGFLDRPVALAVLGMSLLALSCRREPAQDEASIRRSLAARPGAEVLAEAEKATYAPPADGRLSAAQMEMYVAVERREARIREVVLKGGQGGGGAAGQTLGAGEAGALGTADLRAARELGYNLKEYRWVKARVLETELAAAEGAMARDLEAGRRRYLESLEARRQVARDPAERAELERQIAEFRRRAEAARPRVGPAVQYNVALLARFRDRLAEARAAGATQHEGARAGQVAAGQRQRDD